MDNREVARLFADIGDLLEIKGENAFKIRAYRSAADLVASLADPVVQMDDRQLRELPGIGKDLAAKIREIATTGGSAYLQELLQQFPATILDLLRLRGIGPKTVALLYSTLGIATIEALHESARGGRLRGIKGIGPRKEAQIIEAITERQTDAGRHLLADTAAVADEILTYLRAHKPEIEFVPVGSLRRGCETCGDIDILAVGGDPGLMDLFCSFPRVDRILGRGDTKSSVRLLGHYQADLRLVPAPSRGAAMQYFTGSKAHNVELRERALQRGLTLNEYGLFRLDDETTVAGDSEEGIYAALGLAWIPPELREHHGEISTAAADGLPTLLTADAIRGDLHSHTTATDGRDDLETMAAAAAARGYQYLAITDHSRALAMANGLDEHRALEHARRVRALNGRFPGLTLLAGIECDILPDGRLDLSHDCLAELDIVVASVHSQLTQDEAQVTDRVLRALECPWVDILGHPTSRLLLRREPSKLNVARVIDAAVERGVALEINCLPDRLDLNDSYARAARTRGARLVISTDAHSAPALDNLRWGIQIARRAWATADDVINTRDLEDLRPLLRRNRSRS